MGYFPIRQGKTEVWHLMGAQEDRAVLLLEKRTAFQSSILFSFSGLFSEDSSSTTKVMDTTASIQIPLLIVHTFFATPFLPLQQLNVQKILSMSLCLSLKRSTETFSHHFLAWREDVVNQLPFYWSDYSVKTNRAAGLLHR